MYVTFGRIAEIALYSALNFLPYLGSALYPFRNSLRYSMRKTVLLAALVTLLQVALGLLAAFSLVHSGILSALSTIVYCAFYFWAVRTHPGKVLFMLLMFSNIANCIVVCSKCIEGQLFPGLAVQPYRLSFSAVMAVVQLIALIPLFFYYRKTFTEIVEMDAEISAWKYLWLVPATFYLVWFYHLYANTQSSLEIALQPAHALFLLSINAGAFLIYHMIALLIIEYDRNSRLEKMNHALTLETLQYENLQEKIRETRQARHDLRHHITVMTGLLNEGNAEKLRAYLDGYRESLPDDAPVSFCRNGTVNLLLQHFSQQAKLAGIRFTAYANIPENLPIAEHDLAVILGNLLENAVDACSMQKSMNRKIIFRGKFTPGKYENSSLVFTIDNTFEGDLDPSGDGSYHSTKHREPGIGLSSAKHITARYKGVLQTEQKDGIFCASVLLNLSSSQKRSEKGAVGK
ncbi:GHKL domain-containing protein [Acetatifactor muris]|uniref:Sensor histidine kinase NatK-like C-terminal domain-containing protein n=1 Tax=Acetatifactor muris TaxID=879566 RepID=A0A2K4ZJZ1_9FIRM|nr:GHKL domain-containing protein [Acetatifactor muris]MCR2049067.1 GHKL domain-containing protein [Acetatifactor muris]SOY30791.1 hypothetical protein AMURIS_03522 [Acetatifactor muris]